MFNPHGGLYWMTYIRIYTTRYTIYKYIHIGPGTTGLATGNTQSQRHLSCMFWMLTYVMTLEWRSELDVMDWACAEYRMHTLGNGCWSPCRASSFCPRPARKRVSEWHWAKPRQKCATYPIHQPGSCPPVLDQLVSRPLKTQDRTSEEVRSLIKLS